MAFVKGKSGNPKGCPKGAHHIGRPRDEVKRECVRLATSAAPLIMARLIRHSLGEKTEQVVTENGVELPVPAAVPSQIKASEVVLTYVLEKAAERLEISGADGDPLNGIPTTAVFELVQALRKRSSGDGGEKP